MKKIVTIFALLLFIGTNALYAQPQTERIRKEIKQKGATAHLLTRVSNLMFRKKTAIYHLFKLSIYNSFI